MLQGRIILSRERPEYRPLLGLHLPRYALGCRVDLHPSEDWPELEAGGNFLAASPIIANLRSRRGIRPGRAHRPCRRHFCNAGKGYAGDGPRRHARARRGLRQSCLGAYNVVQASWQLDALVEGRSARPASVVFTSRGSGTRQARTWSNMPLPSTASRTYAIACRGFARAACASCRLSGHGGHRCRSRHGGVPIRRRQHHAVFARLAAEYPLRAWPAPKRWRRPQRSCCRKGQRHSRNQPGRRLRRAWLLRKRDFP